MKKLIAGLAIAFTAFAASAANATPVSVDFSKYDSGTPITSQIDGLFFKLIGGPGPVDAPTTDGSGLSNSVYAGDVPTATILSVTFSDVANGIKFVFDPRGYYGSVDELGDTYYSAFDLSGKLVETGKLGSVTGGAPGEFSLSALNVHELQFNNGSDGTQDWVFRLNTLSADVESANVPEPASLVLMAAGLLGVGAARRRKRK